MATWTEFEADEPGLAAVAGRHWPGIIALDRGDASDDAGDVFSIAYLATVRRDGGPRVHPFCPILVGGRLFGAIPRTSPKGWDLRRDPRCVIHALPGPDDDELCIRAVAREVVDGDTKSRVRDTVVRSGVGGMVAAVTDGELFEFDIEQVDVARWLHVGQPGTRAERRQWRTARRA